MIRGRSDADDDVVDIIDMLYGLRQLTHQEHDHNRDEHYRDARLIARRTVCRTRLFSVSARKQRSSGTGRRAGAAGVARRRDQLGARRCRRHYLCKLDTGTLHCNH